MKQPLPNVVSTRMSHPDTLPHRTASAAPAVPLAKATNDSVDAARIALCVFMDHPPKAKSMARYSQVPIRRGPVSDLSPFRHLERVTAAIGRQGDVRPAATATPAGGPPSEWRPAAESRRKR